MEPALQGRRYHFVNQGSPDQRRCSSCCRPDAVHWNRAAQAYDGRNAALVGGLVVGRLIDGMASLGQRCAGAVLSTFDSW